MSPTTKSIKQFSANCHEDLLLVAMDFLRTHQSRPGLLIVTGNKLAADELVYRSANLGLCGAYRLTVDQLAQELSRKRVAEEGRGTASALALDAVVRKAVDAINGAGTMSYFNQVASAPRFSAAVLRTVTELRLEQIQRSQLFQAGPAAADIARLLERYAEELGEHRLTDISDRLNIAIDIAIRGRHPLCGLPVLLLCPTIEHEAHRQLLGAMVEHAPVTLGLSLHHDHNGLSEVLKISPTKLTKPVNTCLDQAQERAFAVECTPSRPKDETFDMFSASGEALECVEIVRRISEFAASGTAFDQIAVLLRSPERYQAVLEEAFLRSEIPAWFSHGTRRPLPVGRAFLALLECARENFSATRFLEYLSLGQAPRRTPTEAGQPLPVFAPALWERFIVDAAVIGGTERWSRRLEGLSESFRSQYATAETDAEREVVRRHIEAVDDLVAFAIPLIGLLEGLPVSASWGDWLDQLRVLAEASIANSDALSDLFDEMEPLRDVGGIGLDDVLMLLGERLRSMLKPPSASRRYGCVYIGSADEAKGMAFEVVFVPGLSEGMFPRPITEDPLLLNDIRQRISPNLKIIREENERSLLRAVLAASTRKCVCSYPRIDLITGRARVPSLYFFELAKAAYGQIDDIRQMERDARRGAQTSAGWPAPNDEMDAIDAAEYDLAVLRPSLQGTHVPGLGAYLTRLEGPLANSLRARWLRWNETEWKWPDGVVNVDVHTQTLLDEYSLHRKTYSPSALQDFAACPYRFALKVVHRLRPSQRPEMLQRMDSRLRGLLFHRVAFLTIGELRTAGFFPLNEARLPDALQVLDQFLQSVSADYALRYAPAINAIWDNEVSMIRADLRGWLQKLSNDDGWQPCATELAFGRPVDSDHDPSSIPNSVQVLDYLNLIGSIDLIDRHVTGAYRITDYKTRRVPYPQPQAVGGGEYLQPLLYSLAAEAILGPPVAGGRLYYATMRGAYKSILVSLNDYNKRALGKVLDAIDSSILAGFLPAAPREGACNSCDYLSVCGPYEEDRVRKKSRVELKSLIQVRGMK